jgi:anti-sigma factor RsiW
LDCRKAEYLLHGYLDGELELIGTCEFELHLAECAPCTARLAREQSLRARFQESRLRAPAPPHLRERIQNALEETRSTPAAGPRPAVRRALWAVGAAAALVVMVKLVTLAPAPSPEMLLAQQVRDGHVRSLMANHLKDVESTDQHTVKPWFAGRLDYSPWVANLADDGFPLQGGRLDYIDNRPVAALIYKRREHVINLFVWPAPAGSTSAPRVAREHNFQMLHWSAGGMTFWAISDLNAVELREFVDRVNSRVAEAGQVIPD